MLLTKVLAVLSLTVPAGTADPDTVSSVHADMSVNNNIRDWKTAAMLNPAHAPTLDVFVCPEHLPPGSPTRANLEAAVGEWNDLLGVEVFGQVRPLPGTQFHPLAEPNNFTGVFVDYRELTDVDAQMKKEGCGISLDKDPANCDRLYLRLDSSQYSVAMNNPNAVDLAVAKRVFAHELAHGFGLGHPAPDGFFDPQNAVSTIRFDGASNHGDKFHFEGRAWPSTMGSAKDHAWMRHYYPDAALGDLGVDELIVHPIMSLAQSEDVFAELTFWRGYKQGQFGLWDKWNQTSVYWSDSDGAFLGCTDDALEHDWMARFSEVSTNTTNTVFSVAYQLAANAQATAWTTLTEKGNIPSHIAGTEFNQKTYKGDFTLDGNNTGINAATMPPTVRRKLRFVADVNNDLTERSESNNILEATICFHDDKSNCGKCDQPTAGSLGSGMPCFDDDDCESGFCEPVFTESGFVDQCNEVDCDECTFDSDPTDGSCDNTPLPNGNPGVCEVPELCMGGQCTNPGTCGGGICAPDCSVPAGPVNDACAPGFTPVGYCPAESSCAGGQFNCDCIP